MSDTIEWGFPTVDEQWYEAIRKVNEKQMSCKHQWKMHEVTLKGKPVSIVCMHCNQIHKLAGGN